MGGFAIDEAAEVRWERVAATPADLRDALLAPDAPVLRSRDGALWTVRDGALVLLAEPTPLSREADHLVAAPGAVGVLRGQPARVQWHRDGGWAPPEDLPVEHATSIAVEADGTAWVAALFGQALTRPPGGAWRPIEGLDANLFVAADPTGGAWFWSAEGPVEHRPDPRPARRGPVPWSPWIGTLGVDPAGRPFWADTGGVVVGGEVVAQGQPRTLAVVGGGLWAVTGREVARLASRDVLRLPEGPVRALGASAGEVWALGEGALWRAAPGPALGLGLLDHGWTTALAGLTGLQAGDVDGDGLDDLVATDAGGALRLFRQERGELVDRTVDLLPAGLTGQARALCDLDGDGRREILAGTGPATDPPLRWLRWRSGRLVDATAEVGLPPVRDGVLERAQGTPLCADLTADGAPDLLIPGGGSTDPGTLRLFANDGSGHLVAVALPARGLALPGVWTTAVHPADLDRDGRLDVVHVGYWGEGHGVLRGTADGWEDVSAGSGLRGLYELPASSWLTDLDGDGARDLLVAGPDGIRAWTGEGLAFTEATARLGLRPADRAVARALLADLDADGRPDLLVRRTSGAWEAWTGGPGGFTDRGAELPLLPAGPTAAVLLDLGGDGPDVIGVGESAAWVLTSRPREVAPARAAWAPLRPWWWTPVPLRALVALGLGAWLPLLLARRAVAVAPLGAAGALLAAVGTGALGWAALDAVPARAVPAALGACALPLGWWALAALALRREAARVIGGYRLGPVLGEGASGTVFLARSVATGEPVALKRLRPSLYARPEERDVLRREAEIGASIRHPHVVRILGWGEWRRTPDEEPAVYVVLELLGGPTLGQVLATEGPLRVGEAARVVRDAALGLHAVHAAGVVHRDVKPQNLAFTADGEVKLMDFGAARPLWRPTETVDRFLGTVGYLAPERLRGEGATVATDVYALGVVLVECLGGARADDLALLAASAPARPARADLPDALWAVATRAVDPDPAARFADAAALAAALEPFVAGGSVARPSRPLEPAAEAPLLAHASTLWAFLRAYVRHAREGGAADGDAFAARWLARTSSAPRTRRRTEEP